MLVCVFWFTCVWTSVFIFIENNYVTCSLNKWYFNTKLQNTHLKCVWQIMSEITPWMQLLFAHQFCTPCAHLRTSNTGHSYNEVQLAMEKSNLKANKRSSNSSYPGENRIEKRNESQIWTLWERNQFPIRDEAKRKKKSTAWNEDGQVCQKLVKCTEGRVTVYSGYWFSSL